MRWFYLLFVLTCAAVTGCADPSRNLYQGIKMRNEMGKTPEERATTPSTPSYDQYKKEREQQNQ